MPLSLTLLVTALCFCVCLFVCLFVQTDIVTTLSHELLSSLNESYREYSVALTDDLIRFWRSEVKVTEVHRDG